MPVATLKVAQDGRFCTLNESASPLVSLACGVKVYAVPAVAMVAGVPEMVGGLAGAETVIEKAGSEALAEPSLTEITILEKVPTLAVVGVPESWPVAVLKLAHAGRSEIEKVSLSPLGPLAVGVKL